MDLNWKKLSEEPYKAGFRKLLKRRFELPNGITDDFDLYHDGDVATAIVLTPEQKVVTVKHFRPGPEKTFNELIGGFINPHEDPQDALEREVLEEVGYRGTPVFLGTSYFSAYNTGRKHIFLLENSQKVQEATPEDLEYFEIEEMAWSQLLEQALQGNTTDLDAILLADRFLNATPKA